MTDRDALYAAILAHPDEDTPRLALADYLEEHDETEYAAFIRKQIELAKVPPWDPLWLQAWYHDHNAISGRHIEQSCPKLPGGLKFKGFRRGFPWLVETESAEQFLKHADQLAATIPFQALEFVGTPGQPLTAAELAPLFASPHLLRAKHLTFRCARLQPDAIGRLQKSPYTRNLTDLEILHAPVEPDAVRAIFEQPLIGQLESLRLDCDTSYRALAAGVWAAGGPHRLRSFIARRVWMDGPARRPMFDAPLLRGLKEFQLSDCELRRGNIRALCESPLVEGLESLDLESTDPEGAWGTKAIAQCAGLSNLRRLVLSRNMLGATAIKHLAGSPHLANLRVLDLEANSFHDEGVIALAGSPHLANLLELALSGCPVGDAGVAALIEAPFAKKIIYLNVDTRYNDKLNRKLEKKFGHRVET